MPITHTVNRWLQAVLVAALTLAALVVGASPAHAVARTHTIGISDNKPSTFDDPRLLEIGVRTARLVIPWNAISREPARTAQWMDAARRNKIQPLIAFDRTRGNNCPQRPCYLPSRKQFDREFRRFRKKYPYVRYYTPWNEANHPGQPTAKRPDRVADFHDVIADRCKKCKIIAGDPLDTPGVGGWMRSYEKRLKKKHKRKVAIWGLHNYISANYFSTRGTREAMRATKADIWLTETGGIVQMLTFDATRLNYDEDRAARALQFAFDLMAKYPCRAKRMYVYNWQAAPRDRFDTGVINPDGRARPAFGVLENAKQARSPVQQGRKLCSELRARQAKARKAKAGKKSRAKAKAKARARSSRAT